MNPITALPAVVTVGGEKWSLHSVRFRHGDATFVTYLYARSWKEAEAMLESLKESGEVDGVIEGWLPGDVPVAAVDAMVKGLNEPGGES
jgi:hypothetical protein